MDEITTTDLGKFGYRELAIAGRLLTAYAKGDGRSGFGMSEFENDEVKVMMNMNSGNVFLTNEDCQVAMINPGNYDLEMFYSCPNCGHEGFHNEMEHDSDDEDCQQYLVDIGVKEEIQA